MDKKPIRVIMWAASVLLSLIALSGIVAGAPGSWSTVFLFIPALLINPKFNGMLRERYNYRNRWWINLCAALIPMFIIGVAASNSGPDLSQSAQTVPPASSTVTSVASVPASSSQVSVVPAQSSSSIESSAPSSASQQSASSVAPSSAVVSSKTPASSVAPKPISSKPEVKAATSKAPASSQAKVVQATAEPKQTPQGTTVYITKTGGKYHRDGCRYLRKSKIAISLGDAKSEGYGPCSVCDPPD